MERLDARWRGAILIGTLSARDMIPCFADVLASLRPRDPLVREWYRICALAEKTALDLDLGTRQVLEETGWFETEQAAEMLADAEAALSAIAPEGTWFGSHPSDGACWGFWDSDESPSLAPARVRETAEDTWRSLGITRTTLRLP